MKRVNIILLILLCVPIFCSCEEEDAKLRFSVELNTNPEAIKLDYSSPDPLHIAKAYSIRADNVSGVLILGCDNASGLYFKSNFDSEETNYYENEITGWSAEIIDGNQIKFIFNELELNPDLGINDRLTNLHVYGNTGKKIESTYITVYK